MDNSIRRNEKCIIGLPRCDFVFSSTRTCFIAYGFDNSALEMTIIRNILRECSVEAIEAGGSLAPGQNAFCTKICSKIITSQFCVVLINNDESSGSEIPNANVNMEYGLMLGFNKYVIPFQRRNQQLPFNVAGLDTIKYDQSDFERKAREAIIQAIENTQQNPMTLSQIEFDQRLATFLLSRKAIVPSLSDAGDKALFDLGSPIGFNLLNDFAGNKYTFFGNFTTLRPDAILWRINLLEDILSSRGESVAQRVRDGLVTFDQGNVILRVLSEASIWILVTSNEDKEALSPEALNLVNQHPVTVFSIDDITQELESLPISGVHSQ